MRFRIPYDNILSLADDFSQHELFAQYSRTDAVGDEPSDIRLLLLGTLRYIGHVWTLADLEEANGYSRETIQKFLSIFLVYGSIILYQKWTIDPLANREIDDLEKLFRMAGCNDYIGSSDATNIAMLNCDSWAQVVHTGYTLSLPSINYNMTVDHPRWILGSTMGNPVTWNDKTLILYDQLVCGVRDSKIPEDFDFVFYASVNPGDIQSLGGTPIPRN